MSRGLAVTYAVIMAGGSGTRFWPLSTPERPKQLLELFHGRSMLQLTLDRIAPLLPKSHHRIVTIADQVALVTRHLSLPGESFIIEPFGRNTAPAVGLSAVRLLEENEDAIMVVLPADHLIQDDEAFREALTLGIEVVDESDAIVTLGIQPNRPETAYGYIQFEQEEVRPGLHRVITFAEKPNRKTALRFLETGEFLWNSGVFIWSVRRILSEIEEYLPELFAALMEIREAFGTPEEEERIKLAYRSIKPISIDYGVMEKAKNIYLVKGRFDWSDVGSWDEAYRLSGKDESGNVLRGQAFVHDAESSYVLSGDGKPIAVIGLKGVIVVSTEDGTLVCPQDRAQDVKPVAEKILRGLGKPSAGSVGT